MKKISSCLHLGPNVADASGLYEINLFVEPHLVHRHRCVIAGIRRQRIPHEDDTKKQILTASSTVDSTQTSVSAAVGRPRRIERSGQARIAPCRNGRQAVGGQRSVLMASPALVQTAD